MTAREFFNWCRNHAKNQCENIECSKCKLSSCNTKCEETLCDVNNWLDHADELLEIAKSYNINISPEEKAIKDIEKLILESDYIEITDEIKGSLKLAVKKLKEIRENE